MQIAWDVYRINFSALYYLFRNQCHGRRSRPFPGIQKLKIKIDVAKGSVRSKLQYGIEQQGCKDEFEGPIEL